MDARSLGDLTQAKIIKSKANATMNRMYFTHSKANAYKLPRLNGCIPKRLNSSMPTMIYIKIETTNKARPAVNSELLGIEIKYLAIFKSLRRI